MMYNRYIGNTGKYYRVEDEPRGTRSQASRGTGGSAQSRSGAPPSPSRDEKPPVPSKGGGLFGGLLDGLGGGRFDTGDLLLLGLLFFLYKESGDEELLIILVILAVMLFDVGSLFDKFFK